MGDDSKAAPGPDPERAPSAEAARADAAPESRDESRDESPDSSRDYSRDLGVVEAITFVTRSCPSGVVVAAAERALDAIKAGGPDVMKQQAYFVLTSIKGWRGERARQVHRSLTKYLED